MHQGTIVNIDTNFNEKTWNKKNIKLWNKYKISKGNNH